MTAWAASRAWVDGGARARSWWRRVPLPPGSLQPGLDEIERANRRFIIDRAAALGPIFKGWAWDELWIVVTGLERCRSLLQAHGERLRPVTLDLWRRSSRRASCARWKARCTVRFGAPW